ncbi:MAG: ATP-dependent Clp protease ATP-binding subunit [Synergistaceae bacterium]
MRYDFTEQGKKIIRFAQNEAMRLKADSVGTEHLLLALLEDKDGIISQVLAACELDAMSIRKDVQNLCQTQNNENIDPMIIDIPTSPAAKRSIEHSMEEAKNLGASYIGTEHILLGLLAEEDGIAAQFLNSRGITLSKTRKIVAGLIGGAIIERIQDFSKKTEKNRHEEVSKNRARTPVLDQLANNLSEMARRGELDPVVGRAEEIQRVIQILSRRTKNNPILIGDPGVGKTAVVEGLAQKIILGDVPEILKDMRVMQLNIATVVAGTKYRGEFEERMHRLVKELILDKKVILFIDEIHTLIGAGGAEGAIDAANILKPSLSRGEIQIIGATTTLEYRKYVEKDAAFERRFQPVRVEEPSIEDTILVLKGLRGNYEKHHKVTITDEAIDAAAKLSKRYIADRFLPDKAIDLIDEASARARIKKMELPSDIKDLEHSVLEIRKEKNSAVSSQEFEKAADLRDEEKKLIETISELRENWVKDREKLVTNITFDDIAFIVSESTGIPVTQLSEEESKRLLKMEETISQRLIGQEESVIAVAKAIRRTRSGMKDPKRPVGSFLFLGPTGVGKTELAKSLSNFLFGRDDAMIRVDMSEYMEKHEASKLIGAPPGYVGFEEGGKLTEAVRRKPYSVILFDEMEKAHPDVINILLQLLDDGRLTDGQGRVTDFRNSVIIMTSNIGVKEANKGKAVGFELEADQNLNVVKRTKEIILAELNRAFKPEFLNRIDNILVFNPLAKEDLSKIVFLLFKEMSERALSCGVELKITDDVVDVILKNGYDPKFGARPLRRTVERMIGDNLSNMILGEQLAGETKITVSSKAGELNFEIEKK